jgi:pyrroline-5-carboxylate reductase
MRVAFLGGGNMAGALIGGLLERSWAPADLLAIDVSAEARARLARQYGVATRSGIDAQALAADCVVLAVKPQQMREVALAAAPHVREALVVTIAAGIRLHDLSRWLGAHPRLVRAMPNTPALIGQGISGLYAAPGLPPTDRERADAILSAVGATLWVAEETQLDAVTAVSGSGPAYVFYFVEALEAAARELGLEASAARRLALDTFRGAIALAATSDDEPAVLRERVTSKGGTTECALSVLDQADVSGSIRKAVASARDRAIELGDRFGRD